MKIKLAIEEIVSLHNDSINASGEDHALQSDSGLTFAVDHIEYNKSHKEKENLVLDVVQGKFNVLAYLSLFLKYKSKKGFFK